MSNQVSAIKSELSRVREAKRNAEGMVELLRSDMKQGRIHLRVNDNAEFRQKVAEAIVAEAHPGYHGQGFYYADPVEGRVFYRERNAAWNPWSDSIDWRIVPVDELANQDHNDFSDEVDWKIADIPYRDMAIAYLESDGEELDPNGDIPEWVDRDEVIAFARNSDDYSELIEQIEQQAHEEAVSFALSEFLDEVVIEPLEG